MEVDYLVVGSGLTGATIARQLHDSGHSVLVIEKRKHLGGNVADEVHSCGIRMHTYGPHYFRTSSDKIWEFVNRFDSFYNYEATVLSDLSGQLENWPISAEYIKANVGENWQQSLLPNSNPLNLEDACLSMMPRLVYKNFIKEYNEKQWGKSCPNLSPELCKRFNVRTDGDYRLTPKAKYQGLPSSGYTTLMTNMLKDIPTLTDCDFFEGTVIEPKIKTIFTGPIDRFFDFEFGRLAYRAQKRETRVVNKPFYQVTAQVNNPLHSGGKHIRTIEWKHLAPNLDDCPADQTLITLETPYSPLFSNDYEYPFPDQQNKNLYNKYREKADQLINTIIVGRLGEYKYYDMDQAIGRAMTIAERILNA